MSTRTPEPTTGSTILTALLFILLPVQQIHIQEKNGFIISQLNEK
jgi:hypothetical protein